MVLEQLFKVKFLEKKPWYAFLMGLLYSMLGILSATLIFPQNIGMISVAFTSLLLLPSLNKLLLEEENREIRENKLSIKQLFKDHRDVFEIYGFVFFGIFFAHFFLSILLPADYTQTLFLPQLRVAGLAGAAFDQGFFISILTNNLLVLFVCFALSLIYGAGSILFLTWNASVWGAVIGIVSKDILSYSGDIVSFIVSDFLPLVPHLLSESTGYISAAIVGGVLSKAVIREKLFSKKFHHIITDAFIFLLLGMILIIVGAYIESII